MTSTSSEKVRTLTTRFCEVGDHVRCCAAVELADGDDEGIEDVEASGHVFLQLPDEHGTDLDRVLPVAGREAWVPLPRTVMLIFETAAMYEPRRQ